MHFCIRDDDTSFFTEPDALEQLYGEVTRWGPVSLAVVPFHRAGTSKAVPASYRGRWSVHPLHKNRRLVHYLQRGVEEGRFEIMLHGYHHDEPERLFEFARGADLDIRVGDGKKYLEDLLGARVRVFVPPRNGIGRDGLRAIARHGLNLAGAAGIRGGWSLASPKSWSLWLRLRRWKRSGAAGLPWVLDLGDHREIPANPVTPLSSFERNRAAFDRALALDGTFCAATHYWETGARSLRPGEPTVGEHLNHLIERARSDARVVWRSVGDVLESGLSIL